MNYSEKVDLLVDYFRGSEVASGDGKLGLELEHMVLDGETLETLSYREEGGIEDLLRALTEQDWEPVLEGGHVVGLTSEEANVTLEPGGQLELSIGPRDSLDELESLYREFLQEVLSILEKHGSKLMALGYQPESRVKDIEIIPKPRYDYMYDYLGDKGEYAHNMMKGTGAIHVNVDYFNETDYIKKNAVANYLAPVVYAVLDNSPFFEGEVYDAGSLRARIWDNCDPDRCGYPEGVFVGRFGYEDYAEYVLNVPVMVYKKDGNLVYEKEDKVSDIMDENTTEEELEYLLSTVFPDVRTKGHLEVRMADSLPYPYSLSYAAFWKGLLYDRKNLDFLYRRYRGVSPAEYSETREEVRSGKGGGAVSDETFSFYRELLKAAESGLAENEVEYLEPLKKLTAEGETPKARTLNRLDRGKQRALSWCEIDLTPCEGMQT